MPKIIDNDYSKLEIKAIEDQAQFIKWFNLDKDFRVERWAYPTIYQKRTWLPDRGIGYISFSTIFPKATIYLRRSVYTEFVSPIYDMCARYESAYSDGIKFEIAMGTDR